MDEGKWFDREGKRAIITQYHEVIGDLLGRPAQITVQVRVMVQQSCRQMGSQLWLCMNAGCQLLLLLCRSS